MGRSKRVDRRAHLAIDKAHKNVHETVKQKVVRRCLAVAFIQLLGKSSREISQKRCSFWQHMDVVFFSGRIWIHRHIELLYPEYTYLVSSVQLR